MSFNLLIYGGTSEGRKIAEYLIKCEYKFTLSVATEYGMQSIPENKYLTLLCGRQTTEEMKKIIENYDIVIDATHPYAEEVTANINHACTDLGKKLFRVARSCDNSKTSYTYFNSADEAAEFLSTVKGDIFVTVGTKEIMAFGRIKDANKRVYARVLPTAQAILECEKAGLAAGHIICMQGPFSKALNSIMFKETSAEYLVTKCSGNFGGFREKAEAAEELGMQVLVIGKSTEDNGLSLEEVISQLNSFIKPKRKIYIIGIGMGNKDLTENAINALNNSDVIIGAGRIVNSMNRFNAVKINEYQPAEITKILEEHQEYVNISLIYSGDIGFYSGAAKVREELKGFDFENICGISSVQSFFAQIEKDWSDIYFVSLHGRKGNIIGDVLTHKKVFALCSENTVDEVCSQLCEAGLNNAKITVGERMSYEDQNIISGTALDFKNKKLDSLSVMLIENEYQLEKRFGINDSEFIRDNVPMTKSEIRAVLMSKINMKVDSVVYDIGSGTGSVSVECAMKFPYGKIYAIEKDGIALDLTKKNKEKFNCYNIEIINGSAPEALEKLPNPDFVFIGGSGGNVRDIIKSVLKKNKKVFLAVTTVTAEGFSNAVNALKELGMADMNITELSVSRSDKAGDYHIMKAQNPVFIITAEGVSNE